MSEQYDDHNQEWSADETQPIDVGEFQDYLDALVERDALRTRVESLEATLADIQGVAELAKRQLMRGLASVGDIQKFIESIIIAARNARPIVQRSTRGRKGGVL